MKRLDADIRALADRMQERRNEARKRVANGEIMHLKFMDPEALYERAVENLAQIGNPAGDIEDLADAGNYGLALLATSDDATG